MEVLFESRVDIVGTGGKLRFIQCKPTIHPEPVLEPRSFVDGAGASIYGTVLRDGGVYRMWYQAWPRNWGGPNCDLVGYAESDNGLDWRTPKLGLVDYAGQGRDNNLVDMSGHPPTVFIDPQASPTHRYRATMCTGPGHQGSRASLKSYGYYTAHSADGFRWEYDQLSPQWHHADVINSIYHPTQQRAIVAYKVTPRINGITRRTIWNAELKQGQWSGGHAALLPDEYDDIAALSRGFASGDYYGMGMLPAGSGTVGFVWQFRHTLPRITNTEMGVFGIVDVTLAYQAGPQDRWLHVPGRPDFISHQDPSFGKGGVYTASCPIEMGDEHWLYFTASAHSHGWYLVKDWQIDKDLHRRLIDEGMARIGIARWPKWRLFGFESDPRGTLDLNLGRLKVPAQLRLNYQCRPDGSIRTEVLHQERHALEHAVPLTGNALSSVAAWKSGDVIAPSPDADRIVRLHLDQATVYAFEVTP